jgi:thiol-disulfide isomerase/thioredoxin
MRLAAGMRPLLVAWAAILCGCGPRPAAVPGPPAAVRLALVDHDGLLARVAAHRGRVVVLDCWSTSCPPCVQEFPGLVALAEKYSDRLACLSLALDFDGGGFPEEALPPVRAFLEGVGAGRVENLLSREESDSMYRKLALDSVPAVYVWKPDGTLARRFDADDARRRLGRPFTYADVELEVRAMLGP